MTFHINCIFHRWFIIIIIMFIICLINFSLKVFFIFFFFIFIFSMKSQFWDFIKFFLYPSKSLFFAILIFENFLKKYYLQFLVSWNSYYLMKKPFGHFPKNIFIISSLSLTSKYIQFNYGKASSLKLLYKCNLRFLFASMKFWSL